MSMIKIKRALISVSDKRGIVDLARGLNGMGVELISTGGTAKAIAEADIPVREVASVTKFPEMLDGRVKTLHPVIAAGILAKRDKDEHMFQLKEYGIEPIDLIVVNLYPFEATIAKPNVTLEEAIENIDIGGPTMIRAAAKNCKAVAVVIEPERYDEILGEMAENDGALSEETRFALAVAAFNHTANYDETIYEYLAGRQEQKGFPELLKLVFTKVQDLRYGENPHQRAAYYVQECAPAGVLANAKQLHGKELSYNNILDMDAAWALVSEFDEPACAIIKHNNPCGVAEAKHIATAYQKAYECDKVSAFGSVIAFNRVVDKETAEKMKELFVEVVVAPGYDEEALAIFTQKKNIRLIDVAAERKVQFGADLRRVNGGLLAQDFDLSVETREGSAVPSNAKPTEQQWRDLLFAWKVAKHVKSNTIVYAKDGATVGIGAGQMSRVDSAFIGAKKAGPERTRGSVAASDAFFPFTDALEVVIGAGATAVVQPGGSVNDEEVLKVADAAGIPMVFTGKRHFRH
ncbi:MAG: bifunctional phosphoribosylaminoimidazolecarboxamide formyltransferase/IMP cyclohydrolase [Actinobacteria bacterium]|nr:bifunctional phosphoribosylaminoimidazolecarboxamide formyltransferase/IMP cyclohydrolase [Actinomycetota bacterium]